VSVPEASGLGGRRLFRLYGVQRQHVAVDEGMSSAGLYEILIPPEDEEGLMWLWDRRSFSYFVIPDLP